MTYTKRALTPAVTRRKAGAPARARLPFLSCLSAATLPSGISQPPPHPHPVLQAQRSPQPHGSTGLRKGGAGVRSSYHVVTHIHRRDVPPLLGLRTRHRVGAAGTLERSVSRHRM